MPFFEIATIIGTMTSSAKLAWDVHERLKARRSREIGSAEELSSYLDESARDLDNGWQSLQQQMALGRIACQ